MIGHYTVHAIHQSRDTKQLVDSGTSLQEQPNCPRRFAQPRVLLLGVLIFFCRFDEYYSVQYILSKKEEGVELYCKLLAIIIFTRCKAYVY
jgi:hypothetical protein